MCFSLAIAPVNTVVLAADNSEFVDHFEGLTKVFQQSNVRAVKTKEENKPLFYTDDYTLAAKVQLGNAFVTYKLDSITGAEVTGYFSKAELVEHFQFFISSDGTKWSEVTPDIQDKSAAGKWKRFIYTLKDLAADTQYLKIQWKNLTPEWANQLGIVKITGSGTSATGGGAPASTTPTATFKPAATSAPTPGLALSDVGNHWAKDTIYSLISRGIVKGYDDGTFLPDANINVDEFIKMVITSLGIQLQNGPTYWASTFIDKAVEQGIVKEGEFDQYDRPITRGEMARIIVRALIENDEANLDSFKSQISDYDVIDESYRDYAVKAYSKGILGGYEDGSFQAQKNASRAEASAMILRMIDKTKRIKTTATAYTVGIYPGDKLQAEADALSQKLKDSGLAVIQLTAAQLEDQSVLNTNQMDCLILMNSVNTSQNAKEALKQYFAAGGDLVAAGSELAPVFNNEDMKIPIFDANQYEVYDIKGTQHIVTTEGQDLFTDKVDISGNFEGYSAVGFPYMGVADYQPLLTAQDQYNRPLGWAAGVLVNFDGPFKDGQWLLFGIQNKEFYQQDAFRQLVAVTVNKMKSKSMLAAYSQKHKNIMDQYAQFQLNAPDPAASVKVSEDGKHFIGPDGKELFLVGANYAGPTQNGFSFGGVEKGTFSVEEIENDFKCANEIGINCFRLWSAPTDQKQADFIKQMARKYGIYLYFEIGTRGNIDTSEKITEKVANIAKLYGDDTMVLGYDLENEPFVWMLGLVKYDGQPSPVIQSHLYTKYKDIVPQASMDYVLKNEFVSSKGKSLTEDERNDVAAAYILWKKFICGNISDDGYSTFPSYTGTIKCDPSLQPAYDAINETCKLWIKAFTDGIRQYDKTHLITIGYNTQDTLMPASDAMGFASHHIYQAPASYEEVMKNLTTMDRLRLRFPNKPITLGEFGYSAGNVLKESNKMIDVNSEGMGEFMIWLYAFAKGYSGANIWMMNEEPIANYRYTITYAKAGIKTERYGIFYYDGDAGNHFGYKPLAYALRFFKGYSATHKPGDGSTIDIVKADNLIGTGYVFKDANVLYVGNTKYDSDQLKFDSEKANNVMVDWSSGNVEVMTTADTTVQIDPSAFINGLNANDAKVNGKYGNIKTEGKYLIIDMLKGEVISIGK